LRHRSRNRVLLRWWRLCRARRASDSGAASETTEGETAEAEAECGETTAAADDETDNEDREENGGERGESITSTLCLAFGSCGAVTVTTAVAIFACDGFPRNDA